LNAEPQSAAAVQIFEVDLDSRYLGERIDKALTLALQERGETVSRARILQAFESKQVFRDRQALKPSHRVDAPMRLEVTLPALAPLAHAFAQDLGLKVLFEDEHMLVVDKPPHMPVHVGPGHSDGTLVNAILFHLQCTADQLPTLAGNNGEERPGIVHRLDRDTSGVMVVAKTLAGQEGLAEQFRVHRLHREYRGIVRGKPKFEKERLETWHGRDPHERKRYSPTVNEGRKAITEIAVEERFDDAALLRFRLHTGRTHQIRMHARMLGHPIVGDELYGYATRSERAKAQEEAIGRQALHAAILGLRHPVSGENMRFESPLPADFMCLLAMLRGEVISGAH
jgi:23S rRNA pseudouridine1911/1915/1917 synthase